MRRIFHLDLDAFFVAVERAWDPSLEGKPVLVGGEPGGRGVVACASYEARPYGIRAGMPLAQAQRLCPHAVFLRGQFDRYLEVSQAFMAILSEYSPFLQPLGLDEAFMDMTGFESLYGPLSVTAEAIRSRIRQELRITASVGIASCKPAAKVASDACKPDGLLEVPPGEDAIFLAPLPVEKLPGIGEVTGAKLQRQGIRTLGRLAATPPITLRQLFGVYGDLLHRWASGQDDAPVTGPEPPKSISRETTFPQDTRDLSFLKSMLRYLVERVGADLRKEGKRARRVGLRLRWADFTTLSRQAALKSPADRDETIYARGLELLQKELRESPSKKVRLIGIGVANLVDPGQQLAFDWTAGLTPHPEPDLVNWGLPGGHGSRYDSRSSPASALDQVLDHIRQKHGYTAVQRGLTLALGDSFPEERGRYLLTACLSR